MFKSKPCTHQWQHDINPSPLMSSACQKPVVQPSVMEERSPEPKPRWNPRPEQIQILESIFNSGMVNPPRDEIRRIRSQLQQFGQVGDANVFYWFQNRKSRSKHKNRHRKITTTTSSSSSDKSSPDEPPPPPPPPPPPEYMSGLVEVPEHGLGVCAGLLSEIISGGAKEEEMKMMMMMEVHPVYPVIANANAYMPTISSCGFSDIRGGVGEIGGERVTVFINEVAFEVGVGPINLREAFGDDAVLLHSSGHPVLTDHLGLTLQPLQHGASYYLAVAVNFLFGRH
ncbi:WUSCHEL-related homeobox 8 [Acorus calamus]|uniref:WUSCHEL-related homeobox 8 n=1 Tax=Acorus calamus TaxID=4465 RepID=A0AAV9DNA8_ACOCL|nr:WUSCHEL-related homeobox 8 [Acorus calamus]